MARYQDADLIAADELVRLLSPLLFGFLSLPRYTRSYNEDLLQECWLQVHKARHSFRPTAPLLPWVFAIARHVRRDAYRRQLRIQSYESTLDHYRDPVVLSLRDCQGAHQDLLQWLNALPESQREVLFMLKVSGMSLEEVARATSSTVGSVKQKAHRAYQTLRRLYPARS